MDAVVSPVGASLQELGVGGVELVCGDPDGPVSSSGAALVPWPNRIRGGRWLFEGETQQLELTEPAAGNALHGLVAAASFAVIAREDSAVTLAASIRRPPGYPFDLDVTVSYRLVRTGVRSTITVVNRSGVAAPVAVGVHPYVRVGDTPAADLRLAVDADRTLLLSEDNLPAAEAPVDGTGFDLRAPTTLADAPSHAAFTSLRADGGRIRLRLADARTSQAVTVWADERFRWAQVYVTDALPGLPIGGVAVALEPMTAPPDAFNSGTDLHWLPPSERWPLDWGIDLGTV
ncbi:galactose mutarotase [Leifsonia sp. EB34]|uniref:aldose epimerase family protein n=1 Tax=Leifsonia sp. EB34 TaxID=3156303 RepID=UPI0035187501